ncbi:SOS response-associated peptidase [Hoeflea sp. WL0058]|uniref:Abasic site processing protein n=1 Tax=Flavimaribacter sediminis TaxID=2865987 RepID=A0AAE2ZRG4_9HYPH|nr:SOS response-associated peptidase [Flavimaribacter sediminis]MBW8639586.1 SOS response-associated peptidase [Flavimaribacter sediminis]
MCGRFSLLANAHAIELFFELAELEIQVVQRYNIAPSQPILTVMAGPGADPDERKNMPDRKATLVRWGLLPSWVKDPRDFPMLINARSETANEKSSFRASMRHRRALVPASGFYEWQREGRSKPQAYWVRPRNGELVAFAGLTDTLLAADGSEIDTGAILTTGANEEFAPIHNRMPVVIRQRDFARWLDCRTQEPRDVDDLLQPVEPGFFEAVPVSSLVNKVANTGPEIQERVEPEPETEKSEQSDGGQMSLFGQG